MLLARRGALRAGVAVVASLLAAACGPTEPTPVPTDPLVISCPASQTAESPSGVAIAVTYPSPIVVGGAQPVSTACVPASGSMFPMGTTTVACSARDAQQRTSACGFTVSVVKPPTLVATKFLAFGDSITGGVLSDDCGLNRPQCASPPVDLLAAVLADLRLLSSTATYSPAAYPVQLTAMLSARYSTQTVTVVNEGLAGETVTNSPAMDRFRSALDVNRPEVVLLQEGVNDLHQYGSSAVPVIAEALRSMVREAKGRGMRLYVGTLLPERECACRAFAPQLIAPANDPIRAMAAAEGALLVDLHQAFSGQTGTLLGLDGLHPNEAGYKRMADTFFDAISATLESR